MADLKICIVNLDLSSQFNRADELAAIFKAGGDRIFFYALEAPESFSADS